jgi:hypothetical protein
VEGLVSARREGRLERRAFQIAEVGPFLSAHRFSMVA